MWRGRRGLGLEQAVLEGHRHCDIVTSPACHILECCEGLAQSVISTVGQAFELRFKQYLHSPPKAVMPPER